MSRPKKPASEKLRDAIVAVGHRFKLDGVQDIDETAVPGWKPKPGHTHVLVAHG